MILNLLKRFSYHTSYERISSDIKEYLPRWQVVADQVGDFLFDYVS